MAGFCSDGHNCTRMHSSSLNRVVPYAYVITYMYEVRNDLLGNYVCILAVNDHSNIATYST